MVPAFGSISSLVYVCIDVGELEKCPEVFVVCSFLAASRAFCFGKSDTER